MGHLWCFPQSAKGEGLFEIRESTQARDILDRIQVDPDATMCENPMDDAKIIHDIDEETRQNRVP